MKRADLQRLAEMRAREATILLGERCYSGAYYLAGYAIECALKSGIAKQFRRHDIPDKRLVNGIHVHDLVKLLDLAGLRDELTRAGRANPALLINWAIVKDGSEVRRYEFARASEARDMCEAVTSPTDGVLPWLALHW